MKFLVSVTCLCLCACGAQFTVGTPLKTPPEFPADIIAVPVSIQTGVRYSHTVVFVNLSTGDVTAVAKLEGRVFLAEAGIAVLHGLPTALMLQKAADALHDAGVEIADSITESFEDAEVTSVNF